MFNPQNFFKAKHRFLILGNYKYFDAILGLPLHILCGELTCTLLKTSIQSAGSNTIL